MQNRGQQIETFSVTITGAGIVTTKLNVAAKHRTDAAQRAAIAFNSMYAKTPNASMHIQ